MKGKRCAMDLISRQAALGCCRNEWEEEVEMRLKSLPPVTSQQKYEDIAKAFQFGMALGFGEKHDEMDRVIEEVRKVITPQPCDDCISRQAVLDEAFEVDTKEYGRVEVVGVDAIASLPPVTPQPKMGRWIYTGNYITDGMLKCSECGFEHDVSEKFSYCPNCGAKMEVEE